MTDLSTVYLGIHTHFMGKGGVGLPTNGSSGRANFLHHPVDLLEGQTLGFPHHEVGVAQMSAVCYFHTGEDAYMAQPIQVPPQMKKTLDFRLA